MMPLSLYIHIPFCRAKCSYCDFLSFSGGEDLWEAYADCLAAELERNASLCRGYEITTIYVGGGTPTILPVGLLDKIMMALYTHYEIANEAEISIEANPGTVDMDTPIQLLGMGFNRISLGVQAFQDGLLRELGRIHSSDDVVRSVDKLRNVGFGNINLDLMFSLPKQTEEDWLETLECAAFLMPEHISCYGLTIEDGTPFFEKLKKGILALPTEETDRRMYEEAKECLQASGYHRYEISNFAREGYESVHNKTYWMDNSYLGFGLGAHSFFEGRRFHNTESMEKYLSRGFERMEEEILPKSAQYEEFMFLGLRMMEGVSKKRFYERFGVHMNDIYGPALAEFVENGLLQQQNDRYFLTERGIAISNQVFTKFLIEK